MAAFGGNGFTGQLRWMRRPEARRSRVVSGPARGVRMWGCTLRVFANGNGFVSPYESSRPGQSRPEEETIGVESQRHEAGGARGCVSDPQQLLRREPGSVLLRVQLRRGAGIPLRLARGRGPRRLDGASAHCLGELRAVPGDAEPVARRRGLRDRLELWCFLHDLRIARRVKHPSDAERTSRLR